MADEMESTMQQDESLDGSMGSSSVSSAKEDMEKSDTEAVDPEAQAPESHESTGEGPEFALLVVLQPDNIRHRVLVTPQTTIAGLLDIICSDLKLDAELISFPELEPGAGTPGSGMTLAELGFDGAQDQEVEPKIHAYVARRVVTDADYVMPELIHVQVFDGTSCEPVCMYMGLNDLTPCLLVPRPGKQLLHGHSRHRQVHRPQAVPGRLQAPQNPAAFPPCVYTGNNAPHPRLSWG